MTMHLHHPALSLNGKKKGKQKFRTSAEAQRARELDESWKDLQKRWGIEQEERKRKRALASEPWISSPKIHIRETPKIPSLNGGKDMSPALKPAAKVYTGTLIKGIATMHKSNAVPVINDEQAIEISRMRR